MLLLTAMLVPASLDLPPETVRARRRQLELLEAVYHGGNCSMVCRARLIVDVDAEEGRRAKLLVHGDLLILAPSTDPSAVKNDTAFVFSQNVPYREFCVLFDTNIKHVTPIKIFSLGD